MNKKMFFLFALAVVFSGLTSVSCKSTNSPVAFSDEWSFVLADSSQTSGEVVARNDWREVRIPHDWSVEMSFDSINGEGCTGYLPGGTGWYRKTFNLNLNEHQVAYIYFDGVYNHSTCWLNGTQLGYHAYGYSPFYYDLSPYLKKGKNELLVKVDRTRNADSRWYTGSGIYRDVKLVVKDKLQIPIWGTYVTTPLVSNNEALIDVAVELHNLYPDECQDVVLKVELLDGDGKIVTSSIQEIPVVSPGKLTKKAMLKVNNPNLWSVNSPYLYVLKTSVEDKGKVVSDNIEKIGIRSIRFDAERGFFLNDENFKIRGVCIHHDGGLVGAAVPKGVWKRRLERLKEAGCNAIRSAHNPASEEFLQLCDEMGFLVQDEFFDEWDYPKDKRQNCWERHSDYRSRGYASIFAENAENDLKSTMLAHRNHPCIIQWSIGNEIEWTYPSNRPATGFFNNINWDGNYFWSQPPFSPEKIKEEYKRLSGSEIPIEKTAAKLAEWTRQLDKTRPVIANCILPSVSMLNGYADQLDVAGLSYRRVMYDYVHQHYPDKPIMGTECLPQWHEWKAVAERPFVAGIFLWTGLDHMGEVHGKWPKKSNNSGLLDQAGFSKPSYQMFKSLWTEKPHIYICSQTAEKSRYRVAANGDVVERDPGSWEHLLWFWSDVNEHWNYSEGESVIVEVYSNCEQVELFQNNVSLGVKKLADFPDHVYRWAINFRKGELRAEGLYGGKKVQQQIYTAQEPVAVQLNVDKKMVCADGRDVVHIECQLVDIDGRPVKYTNRKINFRLTGDIRSLGVDNGDCQSIQDYQSSEIQTYNGRALLIVQANYTEGDAQVFVKGEGLKDSMAEFRLEHP